VAASYALRWRSEIKLPINAINRLREEIAMPPMQRTLLTIAMFMAIAGIGVRTQIPEHQVRLEPMVRF
jgi:hypothetical protein